MKHYTSASVLADADPWEEASSPQTPEGPSINPANGLPMLNNAVDVAGNPFGFDLHHGMSMQHPSDSFGGHSMSGDSIGHDFHSGHGSFGHGSSWLS